MEKEIVSILLKTDENVNIRELGLCFGSDGNVMEEIELKGDFTILLHTEYGDVIAFDSLAEFQQKAIHEFLKSKLVYVLFVEKNWKCEEYADVLNIYKNEDDALDALAKAKDDFYNENKAGIDNLKEYYPAMLYWRDEKNRFQCHTEETGYKFELWVFEKIVL